MGLMLSVDSVVASSAIQISSTNDSRNVTNTSQLDNNCMFGCVTKIIPFH
jgi:hypothetical protein